jgi:hypothetical protein
MRERFFSVPEVPIFQVQSECEHDIGNEDNTFLVPREDQVFVVPCTPAADDAVKS